MKHFFIHIGLHKTGTTAIQRFLAANRKALEKTGYLYPGTKPAHHFLRWLWKQTNAGNNIPQKTHELFQEINGSQSDMVILSSEMFTAGKENNAAKLREVLQDHVKEPWNAKIIIYVRRQDHWLESRYNENIKNCYVHTPNELKKCTFKEFLDNYRMYYQLDYYTRLQPWNEVFGKENIIVRPYERGQLHGDIITDFLHTVGIDAREGFSFPEKEYANTGLTPDAVEMLRLYNRYLYLGPKIRCILRDKILKQTFTKAPFSGYAYLSSSERYNLLKEYEISNRKVAAEYLGRTDGRLFTEECPDPSRTDDGYGGLRVRRMFH